MLWRRILAAGVAAAALCTGAPPAGARSGRTKVDLWARLRQPSDGPARVIGAYGRGCVAGAVALPRRGDGYRLAFPGRRRNFGHPELVDYIARLGARAMAGKLGVLEVGDLAQPRGGPTPSGHASHQSGLDVDVWYALGSGDGPPGAPYSMVDRETHELTAHWSDAIGRVVLLAAADPRVERVFVNPAIKRELCRMEGADPDALRKLRPWWGHDDHFHVRLACPADSPDCVAQEPLPAGDGCDGLDWWFRPDRGEERSRRRRSYVGRIGAVPELPEACQQLLR